MSLKLHELQLEEFHAKFGHKIGDAPHICDEETMSLRYKLIEEKYNEFKEAAQRGDLVEAIDGLMDTLYVVIGTCVSMGIRITPFFNEVHRSNMSKVFPDGTVRKNEYGKTIKPDTYSPADIAGILAKEQIL